MTASVAALYSDWQRASAEAPATEAAAAIAEREGRPDAADLSGVADAAGRLMDALAQQITATPATTLREVRLKLRLVACYADGVEEDLEAPGEPPPSPLVSAYRDLARLDDPTKDPDWPERAKRMLKFMGGALRGGGRPDT